MIKKLLKYATERMKVLIGEMCLFVYHLMSIYHLVTFSTEIDGLGLVPRLVKDVRQRRRSS